MKGTRRAVLALCVMAGVLAGCNEETTRDVQYYLDHADERAAKLAECKNNPGEKALAANCVNAGAAQHQWDFGRRDSVKPSAASGVTPDVQYYVDHPAARYEALGECRGDPSKKNTTKCRNAEAAVDATRAALGLAPRDRK